jgi:hypothetical protein
MKLHKLGYPSSTVNYLLKYYILLLKTLLQIKKKTKFRGLCPGANYIDQETAACR